MHHISKEYVFIQDDYTVTADVYKDERVIFDEVNEQWIDFCKSKLGFTIPDYI